MKLIDIVLSDADIISSLISSLALIISIFSLYNNYKQKKISEISYEKSFLEKIDRLQKDLAIKSKKSKNEDEILLCLEEIFNEYDCLARDYFDNKVNKKSIKSKFENNVSNLFSGEIKETLIKKSTSYKSLIKLASEWKIIKIENGKIIVRKK